MINRFEPADKSNNYFQTCHSTGCSCCSCEYDIKHDKITILKEAKGNITIVKKICHYYKIDFKKFVGV